MHCRIQDLRHKDVICLADGAALGPVCDVEVDTADARLAAIVIYGRPRWCGLLGREDDCVIPWRDIQVIGEDTILVNAPPIRPRRRRRGWGGLFQQK